MSRLIGLDIELQAIRFFLERLATFIDAEYLEIINQAEAGKFIEEDEEANAFFWPQSSEEIGIRAVIGELNALVEWELQNLAIEPLAERKKVKNSKLSKSVRDISRGELRRLIETHYQIKFNDLSGFEEVEEIRRTINAYKHRKGFKDLHRDTDWTRFPEKFD